MTHCHFIVLFVLRLLQIPLHWWNIFWLKVPTPSCPQQKHSMLNISLLQVHQDHYITELFGNMTQPYNIQSILNHWLYLKVIYIFDHLIFINCIFLLGIWTLSVTSCSCLSGETCGISRKGNFGFIVVHYPNTAARPVIFTKRDKQLLPTIRSEYPKDKSKGLLFNIPCIYVTSQVWTNVPNV